MRTVFPGPCGLRRSDAEEARKATWSQCCAWQMRLQPREGTWPAQDPINREGPGTHCPHSQNSQPFPPRSDALMLPEEWPSAQKGGIALCWSVFPLTVLSPRQRPATHTFTPAATCRVRAKYMENTNYVNTVRVCSFSWLTCAECQLSAGNFQSNERGPLRVGVCGKTYPGIFSFLLLFPTTTKSTANVMWWSLLFIDDVWIPQRRISDDLLQTLRSGRLDGM